MFWAGGEFLAGRLRRYFSFLAVLGVGGAAVPARADSGFFLDYGQSAGVWTVYNDVRRAQKDLAKINGILNRNFGEYQTAFTRLGSDFDIAHPGAPWARTIRLELSLDGAALGLVQNPVVPELVAAATVVTITRAVLLAEPAEGWRAEGAVAWGWGLERRLSAVSTDLIESIPFQKDKVWLWGLDLAVSRTWVKGDDRFVAAASWKGTKYHGLEAQTSVALDRKLRSFTQWWETRGDWLRGAWGLHVLAGSHPLPVPVLPRVWDRVANTNPWRELGAMTGAGASWTAELGPRSTTTVLGGFYGGYLGGAARWSPRPRSRLELGSFGIENSSAYRTLGQRVYQASFYLAF